jgi:predicted Zn finger-like uncharacterized protein
MRIACPSCAALYEVPERLLAERPRPVRCARCGHVWTPEPAVAAEAPAPETPPPSPPPDRFVAPDSQPSLRADSRLAGFRPRASFEEEPDPDEMLADYGPEGGGRGGALIGWVISLALLAGMLWAGLAYREQVMAAWPASTRLYAAIGLR